MKYLLLLAITILSARAIGAPAALSDKLVIPLNKWSSQRVLSRAVGHYLEAKGQQVEYLNISADHQWGALKRGRIHFQLEVWEPSMKQTFQPLVQSGQILDAGTHKATVTEDWWYPKYVEPVCPQLPNWRALNQCKHLFNQGQSHGKGIYYGGPWNYGDADIIRALNIDFTINRLDNGPALWQQLSEAKTKQQPIILLNWSPNWTDNYIQGEFIQFPPYHQDCESIPEWGLNKRLTKDCGNRRDAWLKKAAARALKADFPCVYQFVKNIDFTKKMIADASAFKVVEQLSEKQAADKWLNRYQQEVTAWANRSCL